MVVSTTLNQQFLFKLSGTVALIMNCSLISSENVCCFSQNNRNEQSIIIEKRKMVFIFAFPFMGPNLVPIGRWRVFARGYITTDVVFVIILLSICLFEHSGLNLVPREYLKRKKKEIIQC